MGEGSSGPGSTLPPGAGEGEATPIVPSREPPTQPLPQQTEAVPPHPPTVVPPHPTKDALPDSPTDPLPQYPSTGAVPQYAPTSAVLQQPPTGAVPRQPATVPRQQVTDVAPRQPEADVPPLYAAPPPPLYAAPPPSPYAAPPPSPYTAPAPPPPSEVLRYGPGVPGSQPGVAAESVWRTGRRPEPPSRQRQLRRLRRLLGLALTVILLVAAGIVLYLRFFDHPAFHVTGVKIVKQTKNGCAVDVTGRIATNGAAGTVSYQWVFQPQVQAPQPLNQSVVAGQHTVYVNVAVEGQGHGSASQMVTLDVLGPDTGTDSINVTISC
jgi:hypothetical protein